MNPIKLLIILLPVFLILTTALHSQTYITPIVGYEWSNAEILPNDYNSYYGYRIPIRGSNYDFYPLKSWTVGFRASRKMIPEWKLSAGVLYSSHQYPILMQRNFPLNDFHQTKFQRLRALVGMEYKLTENLWISGDLAFNNIFRVWFWDGPSDNYRDYGITLKNRMHLGFQIGLAWNFRNFILRPHFEFGFWNMKNTTDQTATTPINGFGVSVGYQFEW